jgi:hypothetical protein
MRALALLVLTGAAEMAHAEVADKLASMPQLWLTGALVALVFAMASYFASRHAVACGVVVALAILLAWGPGVEPEFLPEATRAYGAEYELHAKASRLLILLGAAIGLAAGWVRRRRANAT